mmetsp:Transcript_25625/g.64547  ORF Transcript_25625/g.64547 Transcript_25625/m.64547 type:complete len:154 (+) Transcript_25625:390-851(+)
MAPGPKLGDSLHGLPNLGELAPPIVTPAACAAAVRGGGGSCFHVEGDDTEVDDVLLCCLEAISGGIASIARGDWPSDDDGRGGPDAPSMGGSRVGGPAGLHTCSADTVCWGSASATAAAASAAAASRGPPSCAGGCPGSDTGAPGAMLAVPRC